MPLAPDFLPYQFCPEFWQFKLSPLNPFLMIVILSETKDLYRGALFKSLVLYYNISKLYPSFNTTRI